MWLLQELSRNTLVECLRVLNLKNMNSVSIQLGNDQVWKDTLIQSTKIRKHVNKIVRLIYYEIGTFEKPCACCFIGVNLSANFCECVFILVNELFFGFLICRVNIIKFWICLKLGCFISFWDFGIIHWKLFDGLTRWNFTLSVRF